MSEAKNPTPSLDVHNLDVHNSETILDTGAAASAGAEPTLASGPTADSTTGRDLGSIGPYRLVKKLGEGGMGQVWLAEQSAPVKRRVALKVIKAGQYDDAALHRFDLEWQTLAIMEHPAIAKVFDAGATAEGQPYFVMEYVPGLPITEYCDQRRLTPRERLDLITKVCEGVQHAHQKAIIHRDLKPSNILVVEVDGKPEAEKLQRETLDTQRRILGLENSETLLSMNSLAATLLRQGRYAEAEKLYRQAFDLQRRVLGPENPHTLATMGSLGWAVAQQGRYAEAEKLERAAFEIERRVQGPEHQDTLISMNAIVAILSREGRYREAEKLARDVVGIQRRSLGPEHPDTLASLDTLYNVLVGEGRYAEAEKSWQQLREVQRRVFGPEDVQTAVSTYNLACVAAHEGKRDEALSLLREAIDHGIPPSLGLGI